MNVKQIHFLLIKIDQMFIKQLQMFEPGREGQCPPVVLVADC